VHFNVSVTSRDLQTSRLSLVSAGEANASVSVSAIGVSCPSLPGYGSPSGVQLNNHAYSRYKHSLTFHIRRYVVSNETCAPIANPPNSAQLGAPPTIPPSYIRVCAVLWECGKGQTDRHTDRCNTHRHTKCNKLSVKYVQLMARLVNVEYNCHAARC